jgi:hypothetical protein
VAVIRDLDHLSAQIEAVRFSISSLADKNEGLEMRMVADLDAFERRIKGRLNAIWIGLVILALMIAGLGVVR